MRLLGWILLLLLVAGLYLQEFCGRVERLPECLQPYARRVDAAVLPRLSAVEARLPAWARKLSEAAKAERASEGAAPRAAGARR